MEEEDFAACIGTEFVAADAAVRSVDIAGAWEEVGRVHERCELGWRVGLEGTWENRGTLGSEEPGEHEIVEDCDERNGQ